VNEDLEASGLEQPAEREIVDAVERIALRKPTDRRFVQPAPVEPAAYCREKIARLVNRLEQDPIEPAQQPVAAAG